MAKIKTGPKVKRKAGGVPAKAAKVEEIATLVSRSPNIIVTEYRGLTVRELQDLRRKLRPKGVDYHVVKNTLFARAADQAGRAEMRSLLSGPTAVAVASDGETGVDEVEIARSVVDEMRTFKALRIVGALLGPKLFSPEDVLSLAKLPSRPQLQATFVGTLQAPLANVVGVLTAAQSQLIRALVAMAARDSAKSA
jgi:large subunit ribosomal protein L10